jgi:alpha-L-fucosidase
LIHRIAWLVFAITVCLPVSAKDAGRAAENDHRMEWWRDARFGMFVHWGLYSGLAGEWDGKSIGSTGNMEWIQQRVKADTDTYAAQALPRFKPKPGFAKEWAKLAKAARCKYLVFTTKHHEGFALHDSKVSEFDAGSVLQRDLVREIVDACKAEGLRVGFYHSVIDWHHPQFAYAESAAIPHPLRGQPYPSGSRDQKKYIDYLHRQVNELVSNYGPVDIFWWDYSVSDFQGEKAWGASDLIDLVRRKQPAAIMNNRLYRLPDAGWSGTAKGGPGAALDPKYGDFMTPEQHVPDKGMSGVNWETCMTMNTTWGYSKYDHQWKSTRTLIETLIEVVSKGGNFLLNVGPMADGTIPQESAVRLQEIGRWLEVNGESIYGATGSPIPKPDWGRVTYKPRKGLIYLHVLERPADGILSVAGLPGRVSSATLLGADLSLTFTQEKKSMSVKMPDADDDQLPSVIRLQLAAEPNSALPQEGSGEANEQ